MIVYLLYGSDSVYVEDSDSLIGVFSSSEKAEKVLDIWKKDGFFSEGLYILELAVDDPDLPFEYHE